jgi:uncharacterized membrane protein
MRHAEPENKKIIGIAQYRASFIPPPAEMKEYELLCPGITQDLVQSYTGQVAHRMKLEETIVTNDGKKSRLGQILAFILGMTAIISGTILIILGKNAQGLAAIIAALATLMGAFFGGTLLRKAERTKKYQEQQQ